MIRNIFQLFLCIYITCFSLEPLKFQNKEINTCEEYLIIRNNETPLELINNKTIELDYLNCVKQIKKTEISKNDLNLIKQILINKLPLKKIPSFLAPQLTEKSKIINFKYVETNNSIEISDNYGYLQFEIVGKINDFYLIFLISQVGDLQKSYSALPFWLELNEKTYKIKSFFEVDNYINFEFYN